MNIFYFNGNEEQIEDYKMASFDRIKTNKTKEQFMKDYKIARSQGNDIINSIKLAKKDNNEKIFELLQDQFGEMIADEDAWGYDFAEVYNVLQTKDIDRAKQILTELEIEF